MVVQLHPAVPVKEGALRFAQSVLGFQKAVASRVAQVAVVQDCDSWDAVSITVVRSILNGGNMFIIYEGPTEVIITTPELEPECLKEFFNPSYGRNLDEYDRVVSKETAIAVLATLHVPWT